MASNDNPGWTPEIARMLSSDVRRLADKQTESCELVRAQLDVQRDMVEVLRDLRDELRELRASRERRHSNGHALGADHEH